MPCKSERPNAAAISYDSPASIRILAESEKKTGAVGAVEEMVARHADERGKMGDRHRKESVTLNNDFRIARDRYLATSRGLPKEMAGDHEKAQQTMNARHRREQEALKDRHLRERDTVRTKKRA
jgi:hypothetical protein